MARPTMENGGARSNVLWRVAKSLLRVAVGVYVGICLLMLVFQSHLLYHPLREIECTPERVGLAQEQVTLRTPDGLHLAAWYVPAAEARGTVLFCHGNAGNMSHRVGTIEILNRLRMNVLLFDYRGYGASEGSPSEAGTYRDAETAWRHLVEQRGVAPGDLVIHGRSLGGAVAAQVAEKHPPRALILESTFTSVPDVARGMFPWLPVRLLARLRYDTLERIARIRCPKLIIHSRDDDLIPFEHGQRLFEAAGGPKTLLEIHGRHADGFLTSGKRYENGLDGFLSRHTGALLCAVGPETHRARRGRPAAQDGCAVAQPPQGFHRQPPLFGRRGRVQ